ncbi:hypothetical protein [Aminobacter sp. DSM 101952]|uniref:hypothetical protein n=1 Tax=Aminobacter sp. DSM 101952 TaxID=2735891 RepID=UPI0017E1E2A7|nr:hypothetical protein [Aminobacter sp. DSM 101952]
MPSTPGADGDPLDGMVIHQAATAPEIVLGALRVQQKEQDGKILRNDRYVFALHRKNAPNETVAEDQLPIAFARKSNSSFCH